MLQYLYSYAHAEVFVAIISSIGVRWHHTVDTKVLQNSGMLLIRSPFFYFIFLVNSIFPVSLIALIASPTYV